MEESADGVWRISSFMLRPNRRRNQVEAEVRTAVSLTVYTVTNMFDAEQCAFPEIDWLHWILHLSPSLQLITHFVENADLHSLPSYFFRCVLAIFNSFPSRRLRRVTFITTTLARLHAAQEINDLFHTSPIEDMMWAALRAAEIQAERQYEIRERDASYDLYFFVECSDGAKINIGCNGDTYHSTKAARNRDRRRNTYLTTGGWLVQRFGTDEIRNDMRSCVDQIRTLINQHGGPVDRSLAYDLYRTDADSQLDLFKITD